MQIKRSFSAFSVVQSAVFQIKDEHKTVKITKKTNWLQFLLVVKADALKQQIWKYFYLQILSTVASFSLYDISLTARKRTEGLIIVVF